MVRLLMSRWNEMSLKVTRSIAPRTLRECRKAGLRGSLKLLLFHMIHQKSDWNYGDFRIPRMDIFHISWNFRHRCQGRTSMASSCTSNAMDCNVTMPRGVGRSTGQTTSTLDWGEGNAGVLHSQHRKHLPFEWSFVPRFWGAPVSWRSTCQMGG